MMETGEGSGGERRVIGVEECKDLLLDHLVISGNSDLLRRLIKNRASQQGLTYSIRVKCFEYIRAKGIENVNVGKMLEEMVPIGFHEFPEEAKAELRSDLSDIAQEIVRIIPGDGDDQDEPPPYQVHFKFNGDSSQSDSEPPNFIRHVLKKTKIRSRTRRKLKIVKQSEEEEMIPLSAEHSELLVPNPSPPLPVIDIVKKEFSSLGDEPMSLEKLLGPPIHQVKQEKMDPLDSYFDRKTGTSPTFSSSSTEETRSRGKPTSQNSPYNLQVKVKGEKNKKRTFDSTAISISDLTMSQFPSSVPTKAALKKHSDEIDPKGIIGLKISPGVQSQSWSSEIDDGMKVDQKRVDYGKGPSPRPPDISSLQIDIGRGGSKGPRPSPPGKEIRHSGPSFSAASPKGLSPSSSSKSTVPGKSQKIGRIGKKPPPKPVKPIMIAPIFEDEDEEEAEEDDLLDV